MRKSVFAKSVVALAALLWRSAHAQVLPFEHYTLKNGLPLNWVTTLYQDSRSRLWIGGDGGVAVYDGIEVKTYGVNDGLLVGHVWAIHESRKSPGTMYIGTHGGGLATLENGKLRTLLLDAHAPPPKISLGNIVNAIFEDEQGVIWCGTSRGIMHVRGDSVAAFLANSDTSYVEFISRTHDGRIWFNLRNRLFSYSPAQQAAQEMELSNGADHFSCMMEDEDRTIWIGTKSGVIFKMREDRIAATRQTGVFELESIVDDREGNLWIPTTNGLLRIAKDDFDAGDFAFYLTENGLPDIDLEFGLLDHEANLWFASRRGGLSRLSERNLTRFPFAEMNLTPDALNHTAVTDGRGHVFVATEKGLWEIWKARSGSWKKHVHLLPDLARRTERKSFIYHSSVAISQDDVLWHSMHGGGLVAYKISPRAEQPSQLAFLKKLRAGRELPDDNPLGVMIDRNDQLWYVIWRQGALHIDPATGAIRGKYEAGKEISGGTPQAVCTDLLGRVWLATFNGGIYILALQDGEYRIQQRLQTTDGLASNLVRSLVQRRNGEMWIGHRHDGISIYKDGRFDTLTTKNGLLHNAVWALAEDEEGRVWIGTSVGVQYTAPEDARKLYTTGRLLGRSTEGVGVIAGANTVLTVSQEELTLFEYGRDARPSPAPPIYLNGMYVNGKERPTTYGGSFSPGENICEMLFAGISFKGERSLRYKYRLLGLNEVWQPPTDQRAVTYGSLPPGKYKFEVTAINAEGVESIAPASVAFTILPPVWQRWWFIALSVLALGGLLYAWHRLRLQRVLAIEKIRSRIATDLHDDIGAGLTHIGLLSEVALRQAVADETFGNAHDPKTALHEMGQSMARVGEVARELSAAMSDVVWSINPKHDSVAALHRRLKAFANEICKAMDIKLNIEAADGILNVKLNPEVRRNLLLIAKEALHNAAKYSGSPSVEVKIEMNGHDLSVVVVDRGQGFASNGIGEGNGLHNMQNRAEKLGGRCEIVSELGKGTKVWATVPHKT